MKTRSEIYPTLILTCLSTFILTSHPAFANQRERIDQAQSAAPPSVSAEATIVDNGMVIVEGSNSWTCMPDTFPGDNAPICVDGVWMQMIT